MNISHIDEDVVSWVTVQGSLQPLLVKMMTDETDATTENEETVECTDLDVLLSFIRIESAAIAEQVDEADRNATIDVKDELERKISQVYSERSNKCYSQYLSWQ